MRAERSKCSNSNVSYHQHPQRKSLSAPPHDHNRNGAPRVTDFTISVISMISSYHICHLNTRLSTPSTQISTHAEYSTQALNLVLNSNVDECRPVTGPLNGRLQQFGLGEFVALASNVYSDIRSFILRI